MEGTQDTEHSVCPSSECKIECPERLAAALGGLQQCGLEQRCLYIAAREASEAELGLVHRSEKPTSWAPPYQYLLKQSFPACLLYLEEEAGLWARGSSGGPWCRKSQPLPPKSPVPVGDLLACLSLCSPEYVALVRRTQTLGTEELQALSGQYDAVYFHPVRPWGTPVHSYPLR